MVKMLALGYWISSLLFSIVMWEMFVISSFLVFCVWTLTGPLSHCLLLQVLYRFASLDPFTRSNYFGYMQGWPKLYINTLIRRANGIFSREITIHTVIYAACTQSWPALGACMASQRLCTVWPCVDLVLICESCSLQSLTTI
jgi:hypothetical protein